MARRNPAFDPLPRQLAMAGGAWSGGENDRSLSTGDLLWPATASKDRPETQCCLASTATAGRRRTGFTPTIVDL